MKVGISTALYHMNNPLNTKVYTDIYPILRRLRGIGYRFIEMDSRSLPCPFSTKKEDMVEIAKLVDYLGLHISSIHIGEIPGGIGAEDKKLREEAIEWIEKSIDLCQIFEPDYIGIHHGGNRKYTIESFRRLAEFSQKVRMKLVVETGGGPTAKMSREMIRLIQEKNVGILVDVGHCWKAGKDPSQTIKEAGEYLFGLHIHDNHGKELGHDEHLIPGEGTINWKMVIRALENVGYEGIFMLEPIESKTTQDKDVIARQSKEISDELLANLHS